MALGRWVTPVHRWTGLVISGFYVWGVKWQMRRARSAGLKARRYVAG